MLFLIVILVLYTILCVHMSSLTNTRSKPSSEHDRQLTIKHITITLTSPIMSLLITDDIYGVFRHAYYKSLCPLITKMPVPITDDSNFTEIKSMFMKTVYTKEHYPNTYHENVELVVVASDIQLYFDMHCQVQPEIQITDYAIGIFIAYVNYVFISKVRKYVS